MSTRTKLKIRMLTAVLVAGTLLGLSMSSALEPMVPDRLESTMVAQAASADHVGGCPESHGKTYGHFKPRAGTCDGDGIVAFFLRDSPYTRDGECARVTVVATPIYVEGDPVTYTAARVCNSTWRLFYVRNDAIFMDVELYLGSDSRPYRTRIPTQGV